MPNASRAEWPATANLAILGESGSGMTSPTIVKHGEVHHWRQGEAEKFTERQLSALHASGQPGHLAVKSQKARAGGSISITNSKFLLTTSDMVTSANQHGNPRRPVSPGTLRASLEKMEKKQKPDSWKNLDHMKRTNHYDQMYYSMNADNAPRRFSANEDIEGRLDQHQSKTLLSKRASETTAYVDMTNKIMLTNQAAANAGNASRLGLRGKGSAKPFQEKKSQRGSKGRFASGSGEKRSKNSNDRAYDKMLEGATCIITGGQKVYFSGQGLFG